MKYNWHGQPSTGSKLYSQASSRKLILTQTQSVDIFVSLFLFQDTVDYLNLKIETAKKDCLYDIQDDWKERWVNPINSEPLYIRNFLRKDPSLCSTQWINLSQLEQTPLGQLVGATTELQLLPKPNHPLLGFLQGRTKNPNQSTTIVIPNNTQFSTGLDCSR